MPSSTVQKPSLRIAEGRAPSAPGSFSRRITPMGRGSAILFLLLPAAILIAEPLDRGWKAFYARRYDDAYREALQAMQQGQHDDAMRLLAALGDRGHLSAALYLAEYYEWGPHPLRNPQEVAHWLNVAAGLGSPDALFRLATMYEHGTCVRQDDLEAAKLYELAASQGHRDALHRLGILEGRERPTAPTLEPVPKWRPGDGVLADLPSGQGESDLYVDARRMGLRQLLRDGQPQGILVDPNTLRAYRYESVPVDRERGRSYVRRLIPAYSSAP